MTLVWIGDDALVCVRKTSDATFAGNRVASASQLAGRTRFLVFAWNYHAELVVETTGSDFFEGDHTLARRARL